MPGENCALYGCPSSRKHGLSFFKIPSVRADDSEHTKALKTSARNGWLQVILRTRESTAELKKRIEASNIYLCELHFKPDCILISNYFYCILCDSCLYGTKGQFMNNLTALES